MKQIRILVILAFIVLLPLSWYKLYDDAKKSENQYNEYIELARDKASMGIVSFASEQYDLALKLYDNYDLDIEYTQMYYDNGYYGPFEDKCENLIDKYPKKLKAYEMLAKYYNETEEYDEVYILQDKLKKRKIKSGIIDEYCELLKYQYDFARSCSYFDVSNFYSGYAMVKNKDGYWGFVDKQGNLTVSCIYKNVSPFNWEGMAGVTGFNNESYIINASGTKIYADKEKKEITSIGYISEGYMSIVIGEKYYVSNLDFEILSEGFDFIGAFTNGNAPAKNGDEWFFINTEGKKISENKYKDIILDDKMSAYVNDRAFVKAKDAFIMIDIEENQVGSQSYEDAKLFYSSELTSVKVNQLWGYIDLEGNMVIKPIYNEARPFFAEYAAVKIKDGWKYMDKEEQYLIEGEFEDAKEFYSSNTVFVKVDGRYKLLKIIKYNH